MMNVTKYLKSSAIILPFGGENTSIFSKVTFLLCCQPIETGQGANFSHSLQTSVPDCGKRALNTHKITPKPKFGYSFLKNGTNWTGIKTGMTVIDQIPSYSGHWKSKAIKLKCKPAENCIFKWSRSGNLSSSEYICMLFNFFSPSFLHCLGYKGGPWIFLSSVFSDWITVVPLLHWNVKIFVTSTWELS